MRHGWFKIPGRQTGDRTIEEQMEAVKPALAESRGKTVLDLGCAEGLLSLEFHKAGAKFVRGMEAVQGHINVAHSLSKTIPISRVQFVFANLNKAPETEQFDIVLALGVIHKLQDPETGLRWAAGACKDLFLIRSGLREVDGIIIAKHGNPPNKVDSHAVLEEMGFKHEKVIQSTIGEHKEVVHYWRRT